MASAAIPIVGVSIGLWVLDRSGVVLLPVLVGVAAMTVLGLVVVPVRSGLRLTPAVGVVTALPFLTEPVTGSGLFGRGGELAVLFLGVSASWVVRTARQDDQHAVVRDSVAMIVSSTVLLGMVEALGGSALESWLIDVGAGGLFDFLVLVASAGAAFLVYVVTAAVFTGGGGVRLLRRAEYRDVDTWMTLAASGALFGLTFELLGWWSVAIAAIPYAFAHGAYRRLQETSSTYDQTIRALARIPEAAGLVSSGHADRTADLVRAVAQRMGLASRRVRLVEQVALLHDIGKISLNDPGVTRVGYTDADLAQWGYEIIREASLGDIAAIVRRHHEPYRRPGQQRDPDLAVEARIVKVCSAYDEAITDLAMSPLEAVERLHQGSVYDFDPDVVHDLRAVLEERGEFARHVSM